jgi:D-arginine dehydrogenase
VRKGKESFEVIIVGCGIAGASLAYFLTEQGLKDVLVLEREELPGQHATGRSASVLVELDPVFPLFLLKNRSAGFLRSPPSGFSPLPLLSPTGILTLYEEPQWKAAWAHAALIQEHGVEARLLAQDRVLSRVPVLNPDTFYGGLFLPQDGQIDTHELLWSYLRHARKQGAELRCREEVLGFSGEAGRCTGVITTRGTYRARVTVDAAGAWAGLLARAAGATPVALTPKRRTLFQFAAPEGTNPGPWPLVSHDSLGLYFKPESGGICASPMDTDPVEPCDARPDDLVIAKALERMKRLAPGLVPRSLQRKWAGLRTFSSDGVFVVGQDPLLEGFFWLAGQGGAGIETSPTVGRIASDLILEGRTSLFDASILSPARFLDKPIPSAAAGRSPVV